MRRWDLVLKTGWTLEYIDALTLEDIWQYDSINDGKGKARQK